MDFNYRIDSVLRCMDKNGIELLIACSNGLQMPDRPDPVVHLSGYRSLGESFVLLHRDGTAKLIVSPAADAARASAWIGFHACIATDDLIGALTQILADRKAIAGHVAIVGIDAFPHIFAERLLAICEGAMISFDDAFYNASGRKTPVEIGRARRAAAIAEQGLQRLLALALPGMRECDLA